MNSTSVRGTSAATAWRNSSVVSTRWAVTPSGSGSSVGPETRITSAPRAYARAANAYPIRPLDGFVTTRTGSRCSRVGPAVTRTVLPRHGARASSSRSASAKIVSGSLMRPGRSLGPSANAPVSGPTNCQPRSPKILTLARVAGWAYMASFMAGATSTGPLRASRRALSRSSAKPAAARARRCAVAGAMITRSGSRARARCASARSGSQSEVSTARPVSASNVTGRTNWAAAAVSTTSTAACSSVSRRASVQLL